MTSELIRTLESGSFEFETAAHFDAFLRNAMLQLDADELEMQLSEIDFKLGPLERTFEFEVKSVGCINDFDYVLHIALGVGENVYRTTLQRSTIS